MAAALGSRSCLDQFGRNELRAFHAETYGSGTGSSASEPKKVKLSDVSAALHHHMWALKVKRENISQDGAEYEIPKWSLDGREVCSEAWKHARGGSDRRHRDLYSMVLRGYGPTCLLHEVETKLRDTGQVLPQEDQMRLFLIAEEPLPVNVT